MSCPPALGGSSQCRASLASGQQPPCKDGETADHCAAWQTAAGAGQGRPSELPRAGSPHHLSQAWAAVRGLCGVRAQNVTVKCSQGLVTGTETCHTYAGVSGASFTSGWEQFGGRIFSHPWFPRGATWATLAHCNGLKFPDL